ncbi:DNA recombination protein RmuC [Georgenia sp. 10Sc9-8]|uniref:DNA recombination protein RmuC n=1 Tax=Georgenia halotolerans TaxID=3028317 RepID=A0ABT5U1S8_9MICO|nr:DNA recombination protein RmuC [Georgenia halotolerans]
MDVMHLVLLVVGVLVGAPVGYVLARARAAAADTHELAHARERAAAAEAGTARLLEENAELRQRAAQDHDVLRALAPVQATLTQVGEHVAELERERAEQFTVLTEQLHHARRSDEELRRTTAGLAGALRSTSARGQWGEVELRRILEAAGMLRHVDFVEQASLARVTGRGTGAAGAAAGRPDVVVHLPGEKYLAIDAKVPFDAYLEASAIPETADGADADRRAALLAAHAKALRGHVDALARRRYHEQLPASPELVVMFVPSEALLGAALEADPTLLEHALRQGVAPTAPASLLALLRTTATIWASSQVSEEARELLDLGRTLYERLATVSGHVTQLGRSLESAVGQYNKMVGSIESRLLVTARSFEGLDRAGLEVTPVDPDRGQVRRLTAAELVGPP